MTEKLNVKYIYRSNGVLLKSNMYCLHRDSYRRLCNKCKLYQSCPYSYMGAYYYTGGYCIKCLRFIPNGEHQYKYLNLYSTDENYYKFNYFETGKIL